LWADTERGKGCGQGLHNCLNVSISDGKQQVLRLWDTGGPKRWWQYHKCAFYSAKAVIFVFDVTNKETLNDFDRLRAAIGHERKSKGISPSMVPIIAVGNKVDRAVRQMTKEQAELWCKEKEIKVIGISIVSMLLFYGPVVLERKIPRS